MPMGAREGPAAEAEALRAADVGMTSVEEVSAPIGVSPPSPSLRNEPQEATNSVMIHKIVIVPVIWKKFVRLG